MDEGENSDHEEEEEEEEESLGKICAKKGIFKCQTNLIWGSFALIFR